MLARFSARFLAGTEEPFTIHATASREAPTSTLEGSILAG